MDYQNPAQMLRLQAERLGPRPALRTKRFGLYRDRTWESYHHDVLAGAGEDVVVIALPGAIAIEAETLGAQGRARPESLGLEAEHLGGVLVVHAGSRARGEEAPTPEALWRRGG